jgi:hypothetical protein
MWHVWGRGEVHTGGGEAEGGDHLEDRGVEGRIILKLILEKWDGVEDWIDLLQGRKPGNEPTGSIKSGEFLE